MALKDYQSKRRFDKTPEPKGGKPGKEGLPRFVVQKHEASRLHYDFRLEAGGVLLSWAVPKGPSLNPEDKHLAIHVEDHPFDYREFEGVIPEGNYGAGNVMIWDEGNYISLNGRDRAETEREVKAGLHKGHITFILNGTKLQGEFALIKMHGAEENAWLLVKKDDEYADRKRDITKSDKSARSGRTMKQIAEAPEATWGGKALDDAPKAKMPHDVRPMLATLTDEPFNDPGWLFEVKWDGYRAVAEADHGRVKLYSRNLQPFEEKFAPVAEELKKIKHQAVLDGEVVALDEAGRSKFQLLQNYQQTGEGKLVYYVFDLLYLDGHDLTGLPLTRRKELLRGILPDLPRVKYSDHVEENGEEFFAAAAKSGLEGMMAKRADSTYHPGKRLRSWLKVRVSHRQEAVIAGWTEPRGSRQQFGSLVLALKEGKGWRYIGQAGTGFDAALLKQVFDLMKPLETDEMPFETKPKTPTPAHWVTPQLVCEVGFTEWTGDGHMRHPVFLGLRGDKPAGQVVSESGDQDITVGGRKLRVTNLNKVYWPEDGYTKGDLISYYREVAQLILPHLKDRPESLNRFPNGIHGDSFYQKDIDHPPAWAKTVKVESGEKEINYLLCQDEATLVYMANLGCIEMNPGASRVKSMDKPDYLVLDLDPEDIAFSEVVKTARAAHDELEKLGLPSYCKTSGATGLHVFVPTGAKYTYEQVRQFAQIIAHLVNRKLPDITSIERSPAKRQRRVYLDYLQNSRGQTIASAYSVRPKPGATVSAPLEWSELNARLTPAKFTIKNMLRRAEKQGDIWKPVLGKGADLSRALSRLT